MKKALFCATAAAACLTAPTMAHAQQNDGWYGRVAVGAIADGNFDPDAPSTSTTGQLGGDADTDTDPTYLGAIGYEFADGFRLEGALDHRNTELSPGDNFIGTKKGLGPEGAGSLRGTTLMLNAIKEFNVEGKVNPYIGLGAGVATIGARASNLYNATTGTAANGIDDNANGFAGNILAGLNMELTDRVSFDIGYKFLATDEMEFSGVDATYEGEYREHSVMAGLNFLLGAPAAPAPAPKPAPVPEPVAVAPPPPPPPPPAAAVAEAAPVIDCATQSQDFAVYFEWDSSALTDSAQEVVNSATRRALENGCSVAVTTVTGYTDTSGNQAYNARLSSRRAAIVRDALVARGIDASVISTDGKGETGLAKATADGVREPLNRRTQILITVR